MMKGQFLLMRVKTHRNFLTVWSLCAGHLLCCPLDPLFIFLLLWGPGDRPVGATFTAPLPFACTWVWPIDSISRRLRWGWRLRLGAQKPSCKDATGCLCPSPEPTFPTGELVPYGAPYFQVPISALTLAPSSLRKITVPWCF